MIERAKSFFFRFNPRLLNKNFVSPKVLLFFFQLLGFTLALYSQDQVPTKNVLLFGLVIVLSFLVVSFYPRLTRTDPYLLLTACMMNSIGLIMIYRLNINEGAAQITWFILGLVAYLLVFFTLRIFPYWDRLTWAYFGLIFALFFVTLIFGHGQGATNWITIMGRTVQLSELNKVLFVFFISSYHANPRLLGKYRRYRPWVLMGAVYLFVVLFFLQRELGTALIFFVYYMFYLFIAQEDKKILLLNLVLAVLGAGLAYLLFGHLRVRVDTWLDPWKTINSGGYQITQALFAISSGGYFGSGLGLGSPNLVPVVSSDFIFAAICEEMGIFTGMGLIMLFLILVYRGFKISIEQNEVFSKYMATGMTLIFAIQALVIFGGVLKLIPLTGITIPFVSYGGSSMLAAFIQLGVLQFYSSQYGARKVGS